MPEQQSSGCQSIDVWGLDDVVAVTTQVRAKAFNRQQQDVASGRRFLFGFGDARRKARRGR